MSIVDLLVVLFPHLCGLRITGVSATDVTVRIRAEATGDHAPCPECHQPASRVHSWYERRLLDTAIAGRETLIKVRVRRFVCPTPDCVRTIFAERLDRLTRRYGRRTTLATNTLSQVAVALGGRAGARMAATIGLGIGRMTLIRLIRALPEQPIGPLTIVGVDDFAFRRGHSYGTVLVDMLTHRVVDVLDDRSAESLATWLRAHPGIQVICRDRASCYAEGASRGAPQANQVADRWHLMHNLSEAVRDAVATQRRTLQAASQDHQQLTTAADVIVTQPQNPAPVPPPQSRLAERTRTRHQEVHTLHDQGLPICEIARRLSLDRTTVRRFVNASTPEQLTGPQSGRRTSLLDRFTAHLHQRCAEGVRSTDTLLTEIRSQGYRGSHRTLRRYLAHLRTTAEPKTTPATIASSRDITSWIMRPADKLSADDRSELDRLCSLSPTLTTIRTLAQGFTAIARTRGGKHLQTWVHQAEHGGIPEIRLFATGLRKDWDAVVNGLTMTWSSGAVEGSVTRIKMLKRQMFGRANADLLRQRILRRA